MKTMRGFGGWWRALRRSMPRGMVGLDRWVEFLDDVGGLVWCYGGDAVCDQPALLS